MNKENLRTLRDTIADPENIFDWTRTKGCLNYYCTIKLSSKLTNYSPTSIQEFLEIDFNKASLLFVGRSLTGDLLIDQGLWYDRTMNYHSSSWEYSRKVAVEYLTCLLEDREYKGVEDE